MVDFDDHNTMEESDTRRRSSLDNNSNRGKSRTEQSQRDDARSSNNEREGWGSWAKQQVFSHLCLAVTFVFTGLIVNLVQAIMFVLIKTWNATLFRRINYYVTYTLNSQIVFLVEWWSGSHIYLYSDPKEVEQYFGKEHALLLLNHCYEIDWLVGWVICDRCQILGNARVYAKKFLQYAPVLGWSWKFQEVVFLERNWEKDKESLGIQLGRLTQFPGPFWLTMFPEGTRFTKAKHEASMIVAREKGLPELKHHLLPRTRGFVGSIPHLKAGNMKAVYDVTVAFKKNSKPEPTVFNLLNGKKSEAYLLMRRIPIEEIPDDPIEMAAWLQKHYQHKDKILDNFMETGDFNPNKDLPEYQNFEYFEPPRRYYSLINMVTWMIIILYTLGFLLAKLFISGSLLNIGFGLGLLAAAYYGMYKLISLTKISSSASTYGQKSNSSSPVRTNDSTNGVGKKSQ